MSWPVERSSSPRIYLWMLALASEWPIGMPDARRRHHRRCVWLGLLGSFIAYLCYFFLIERLGATLASMVTYLFPVVGVALGTFLLHEAFDVRMAIGTALVLVGIGVVTLRYDPRVSRVPREAGE